MVRGPKYSKLTKTIPQFPGPSEMLVEQVLQPNEDAYQCDVEGGGDGRDGAEHKQLDEVADLQHGNKNVRWRDDNKNKNMPCCHDRAIMTTKHK